MFHNFSIWKHDGGYEEVLGLKTVLLLLMSDFLKMHSLEWNEKAAKKVYKTCPFFHVYPNVNVKTVMSVFS